MTAPPRRRVVVTGAGLVSSLADSPAELHEALCRAESGLRRAAVNGGEHAIEVLAAGLDGFDPSPYLGDRSLRPLDRTARLAASAAHLALAASGWGSSERQRAEVGLVLGTTFGSLQTIAEFDRRAQVAGPNYAKPMDFANSVINAAAGQTAIWHGLRGVNATISAGIASGLQAIAYAADLIRADRAGALLAGGAEELCFDAALGFERRGLLAGEEGPGTAVPFDRRRRGFAPGEAAALLMLESADAAERRGATILAEVEGHAALFDGSRRGAGPAGPEAIAEATRQALADAGVDHAAVDLVAASANGSPPGDAAEARALEMVFDSQAAHLPVTAVKSMLGETLGAAGPLQAVTALETLRTGRVPGILGLEETDDGFPLAGASASCRELRGSRALVLSIGFDGKAAALVLRAGGAPA